MLGIKIAILYGLKPHELGFCGPQEEKNKGILSQYINGKNIDKKKIKELLKEFEGAYPYYELIAKSNNIKDPFNKQVIRAYWIGNKLLEKVKSNAHHSFHVLIIGSVTGRIELKGELLDICRVGWGRVKERSPKLKVEYQSFVGKKQLKLGELVYKEIEWNKAFLPNLKVGDWVSFHWNQAIEILNKKDIENLKKYTQISLDAYNKKVI
ncbi:hypothetical protein KKA23_01285 [Patescibacteria group bacterium]|nr:hypothetical protein [Patescibacteria group bacterium]MBU3922636.1 hypothetical protein [Patescibacteria group bacterium]